MIGLQYILELEEMTAAELSEKIGVSFSLVYRWLNGKKAIPKQRVIQIHSKVLPEYPEELIDKEITEADKTILTNIRLSRTATSDYKIKKLVQLENNYSNKVRETLANIAGILSISNNTNLLRNQRMNANIYMLMLANVLGEQTTVLNDFNALYSLEADKRQRSASILVSLVLSALCTALGHGGYIDDIICAEPLRVVLSTDGANTGTFDKEIHDQLTNTFKGIIERYDKRDKILEALNNKIKEEKK